MKPFAFIIAIFLFLAYGCATETTDIDSAKIEWPNHLPIYDHIVIVVEENKDYDEVIGDNTGANYINDTLKAEGANFTRAFGEEHNSQGNYFWLFSGDNQCVGFSDAIPSRRNNLKYPFEASNLGQQLIDKGHTFKGYAESLPAIGDTSFQGVYPYARKHVPWISFANVPNGTTAVSSSNLPFKKFPTDSSKFKNLPTVSFVIPNLNHDMHSRSVHRGDGWLSKHLNAYYQWAKENNSLLILTFDENNDTSKYKGLTNPADTNIVMQNRIVTIFAGAHIVHGDYREDYGITHVNILRTLEAMYGLPKSGAQQPFAVKAGITDDYIITDVFETSR